MSIGWIIFGVVVGFNALVVAAGYAWGRPERDRRDGRRITPGKPWR